MKIGDLSTDAVAHRQEGAYGCLQKRLISNELFDPAAEDITAGFADDETEVLQEPTDLVLEIAPDLDQQGPTVQRRPELLTRKLLDLDLLVPAALHDPRQAHGIAIGRSC